MELKERCRLATEILRLTKDGDKLDARDLNLLQGAVNGLLNEKGYQKFKEIHAQVVEGKYTLPWLHDIEHLTLDQEGYVYWKGQQVEHYDIPWAYGEKAKLAAEELARRCRILEKQGKEVNTVTAIWSWEREVVQQ